MGLRADLATRLDPAILSAYASSGLRILRRGLVGQRRYPGDARRIIRAILDDCWAGDHYVASAGHFRQFWTRDLGFSAVALARLGYRERVRSSLAWALDAWAVRGRVTTTIFPGRRPRDVYYFGIDSLPLLLHALRAVDGADLLGRHGTWLRREVARYADEAVDPSSSLVRSDRRYSTHRDTVRTASNCYANTMLALLARTLEETAWFPSPVVAGADQRLTDAFWRGDRFVDDPRVGQVTGDATVFPFWLGVVAPELGLARALATASRVGLATPLPLRYASRRDVGAEDPVQRLFVPDYQGTSIWTSLGSIYLSLLDDVDPVGATLGIEDYVRLVERDGTFWEVLTGDRRPYRGRLGIFRADEAMLWSAIFLDLLERRALRSADAGRAGERHDRGGREDPQEEVPPPRDQRGAGTHGGPLDPQVERRVTLGIERDRHARSRQRRQDGRSDETQVLQHARG